MVKTIQIIIVIFLLAQFIRPRKVPCIVDKKKTLCSPKNVEKILIKACYDCHSDRVRYPWYFEIAPLSWTMAHHIKEGRKALNFSKWSDIPKDIKLKRLDRAIHTVGIGMMPLPSYKWIHKDAVLTKAEKQTLQKYFEFLKRTLK
jgi:hypothetical protein